MAVQSNNTSQTEASTNQQQAAKKKSGKSKLRGGLRKFFGVFLLLAPVLIWIGRANGSSGPQGGLQSLGFFAALIALFAGGIALLSKGKQ